MQSLIQLLSSLRPRRWIAIVGFIVGLAFLISGLVREEGVLRAFFEGAGAAAAAMVVLGIGERFWHRDEVSGAQGPGGWGVGFGGTKEAVSQLNERVDSQMLEINKRLGDLETAVFKEPSQGTDRQE